MTLRKPTSILSLAALALVAACSKAETPAEKMASADAAMKDRDYTTAVELYGSLAGGGEGITPGDQFKAALEAVKCRIFLDQAAEGVGQFRKMYDAFSDEMNGSNGYKHALAVMDTLDKAPSSDPGAKIDRLIDLLEIAKDRHADKKERFQERVDRIKEKGVTPAALAKLKELGYA